MAVSLEPIHDVENTNSDRENSQPSQSQWTTSSSPPGNDFLDFPDRAGFRIDMQNENFSGRSDINSLLQTWLYFGLIEAITKIKIRPGEFTRSMYKIRPGEPVRKYTVVTSKGLFRRSEVLHFAFERLERGVALRHYAYARRCLAEARYVLETVQMKDKYERFDPELMLSLAALGEFWFNSLCGANILFGFADEGFEIPFERWPVMRSALSQGMIKDGWCRRQVQDYGMGMDTSAMYFVSRLGRPGYRDHGGCNEEECRSANIDESKYETKHATRGCSCSFWTVSQVKLAEILVSGSIPVIKMVFNNNGGFGIDLVPIDLGTSHDYTAISHVWSDGMGNASSNALPMCQMQTLGYAVLHAVRNLDNLRLEQPIYFWMDTLCIPLQPPEARFTAITKMRHTYAKAKRVVVFDGWLRNTVYDTTMSKVEVAIRLAVSEWNHRLWTLQEGHLAEELFFVFKNSIAHISIGLVLHLLNLKNSPGCFIGWEAMNAMIQIKSSRWLELFQDDDPLRAPQAAYDEETLHWTFNGLRRRMTTKASDEAICLATLLDLDVSQILRIKGHEERMAKFWTMLGYVPRMSLFNADAPRLKAKGFRWAPSTLMNQFALTSTPTIQAQHGVLASIHRPDPSRGVEFKAPGLWLDCGTHHFLAKFYVRVARDQWYVVSRVVADKGPSLLPEVANLQITPVISKSKEIAIFTASSVQGLGGAQQRRSTESNVICQAVMVTVEEVKDDVVFASRLVEVSIKPLADAEQMMVLEETYSEFKKRELWNGAPFGVYGDPPTLRVASVKKLFRPDQVWVLD